MTLLAASRKTRWCRGIVVLLVLVGPLAHRPAVAGERAAPNHATPLNPAIFVGGPRSREIALAAIDKAASQGDRRLNVVVSILVDLTEDLRVKSYGQWLGRDRGYQPFDDAMRHELKESLRQVFARMAEHGMEIYILPHIDAGGAVHQWRNWVDFDPLEQHQGYSYEHLMIDTISEALAAAVDKQARVELALSGEMGTSLFGYPAAYQTIIDRLRERSTLPQLKIGVSLNHSGIAGEGNPTGVENIVLSDGRRAELQGILDVCDFVGMSFYRPVNVATTTDDFVRGVEHFMGEFAHHGLSVPTTTPMHFSEVGIGGGDDQGPTDDPAKAVESPWAGTSRPSENPWRHDAMRELRRTYHRALLDFLARQPARWQVTAAFLWSSGSWDPHGLSQEEFADAQIMAAMAEHNRAAADR